VAVSMYSSHAARKAGAVYAQAISVDDSAGLDDDALRDLRISRLSAAGPQLAGTVVEPEYLKELADLLFEKGGNDSLVKAVALYDKLLQKYPDARFAVYAQLSRAKALFALGEYARAAEGFAAVAAFSPVSTFSAVSSGSAVAAAASIAACALRSVTETFSAVLAGLAVLTGLTVLTVLAVLALSAFSAVSTDGLAVDNGAIQDDRITIVGEIHRASVGDPAVTAGIAGCAIHPVGAGFAGLTVRTVFTIEAGGVDLGVGIARIGLFGSIRISGRPIAWIVRIGRSRSG